MPEKPEWLDTTPDLQPPYVLLALEGALTVQEIELTRDEYIALKQHLANLRGLIGEQ